MNVNEENENEIAVHNGHQPTWKQYASMGWWDVRDTLAEAAKFWVAVLGAVGAQALLVLGYIKLNPFVSLHAVRFF